MISVAVYGRNDSHGYNLHRRVALSINCIAEVLTDENDEILFVDWNTPKRLPPFTTAIADLLTPKALSLVKILRVTDEMHNQHFGGRTHLPTVEPVARNVALTRSNPDNHWFLSTNTDMVFLVEGGSLSDLVGGLSDAYYALPRFELPEVFWESLPRTRPIDALQTLSTWRSQFSLESRVNSTAFNRYDAPGDFQLAPRQTFLDIGGFEEEMLLGWHVDSNMAKRLWMHFGETKTLEQSVRGYHCNHTRSLTVHHGKVHQSNDLARFVDNITSPKALSAAPLGLATETISLSECRLDKIGLLELSHFPEPFVSESDLLNPTSMRTSSAAHALAALLDPLITLGPNSQVEYYGNGPLGDLLLDLNHDGLFKSFFCNGVSPLHGDGSPATSDLLIFDFDVVGLSQPKFIAETPANVRSEIARIMSTLLDKSRDYAATPLEAQPLIAVVNADGNEFDRLVSLLLNAPGSQTHSRVRVGVLRKLDRPRSLKGRVKLALSSFIYRRVLTRALSKNSKNWKSQSRPAVKFMLSLLRLVFNILSGIGSLLGRLLRIILWLPSQLIPKAPRRRLWNYCTVLFARKKNIRLRANASLRKVFISVERSISDTVGAWDITDAWIAHLQDNKRNKVSD